MWGGLGGVGPTRGGQPGDPTRDAADAVAAGRLPRSAADGVAQASAPADGLPQTGSGTAAPDRGNVANNGSGALGGFGPSSPARENWNPQKKLQSSPRGADGGERSPSEPQLRAAAATCESRPNTADVGDRPAPGGHGDVGCKGHAEPGRKMKGHQGSGERQARAETSPGANKVAPRRDPAGGALPAREVGAKCSGPTKCGPERDADEAKDGEPMEVDENCSRQKEEANPTANGSGRAEVPGACGHLNSASEGGPSDPCIPSVPDAGISSDPVTLSCSTALPADLHSAWKAQEDPKQENSDPAPHHLEPTLTGTPTDTGVLELRNQPLAICPSVQKSTLKREEGVRVEESAITPDQLADSSTTVDEAMQVSDGRPHSCSSTSESCEESSKGMDVAITSFLEHSSVKIVGNTKGLFEVKAEISADPLQWSVADVASYFAAAGFPEQATAFRTQEIDGKSLLLMQRSDVLTGLSIKLGPALKIYEHHVKVLQRSLFQDESTLG
uniref:SAM domain-containing protein n=2 Tax=Denticeps clupeoides TaxID=299321 RepID=A0AAY4BWQ8_9TELE